MSTNKTYIDPSIIDDDTEGGFNSTGSSTSTGYQAGFSGISNQNPATKVTTSSPEQVEEKEDEDVETMGFWTSIVSFFTDARFHRALGILLLIITSYFLLACVKYISGDGVADESQIATEAISELAKDPDSVQNPAGPVGATIGQILTTNSLGISIFVIFAYFYILSVVLMKHVRIHFWEVTFKTLLFAVTLSISAATFTYYNAGAILYGGMHGRMVVTTLISYGGYVAALGLSAFLILLILVIYSKYVGKLFGLLGKVCKAAFPKKAKKEVDETEYSNEETETVNETDNTENDNTATVENDTTVEHTETSETEIEPEKTNPEFEDFVINDSNNDDSTNSEQEETITKTDTNVDPPLKITATSIETAEHLGPETPYDPTAELSRYQFPPIDLLKEYDTSKVQIDIEEQEENKQRITQALSQYGISIQKIEATVGPTITLYEIVPAEGVRIQQIKNLENDLMLNLAATGIRIIAPMPGRGTIGIEVPNKDPQIVSIRSILSSKAYREFKGELPMAIGATISNDVYIADLAKMPHLLVAGATGQGKSVGMNTIIASLLYKKHPATLKFVLIDPKFVEFSLYSKLERHYLAKLPEDEDSIITTPDRAVATLNSLCIEMDNRYALLRDASCRTIKEYNEKFISRRLNPEKGHRYLPYIVVIVDEFADIIATAGKEIELPISRITAKARAVGIHMILSTQRPSTNVITGTIKANVPARIAFKVSQMIDSRTIIDAAGAQHLIGRGDMLFLNAGRIERVQCALIETAEVEGICNFIDNQVGYDHAYFLPDYNPNESNTGNAGAVTDRDELFEEAARSIVTSGIASTSSLQRRFRIGYNRAGNLIDQFEAAGIVGPPQGMKPRQILMDSTSLEQFLETLR